MCVLLWQNGYPLSRKSRNSKVFTHSDYLDQQRPPFFEQEQAFATFGSF